MDRPRGSRCNRGGGGSRNSSRDWRSAPRVLVRGWSKRGDGAADWTWTSRTSFPTQLCTGSQIPRPRSCTRIRGVGAPRNVLGRLALAPTRPSSLERDGSGYARPHRTLLRRPRAARGNGHPRRRQSLAIRSLVQRHAHGLARPGYGSDATDDCLLPREVNHGGTVPLQRGIIESTTIPCQGSAAAHRRERSQ